MSQYIAPFIFENEYRCRHCKTLPPDWDSEPQYTELFAAFANIRQAWNKPIPIISGYRCLAWNTQLYAQGKKASPLSVHLWGLALDLDCPDAESVRLLDTLIEDIHPELRRGIYTQGGTFVHIDVGYLIVPRATSAWVSGARWSG